jgi:beta-lactamase superfamily II metal-dependent hydrolase
MAEFVDLTTVSAILDRLVDNGRLERRLIDVGQGERSYYRTKAR